MEIDVSKCPYGCKSDNYCSLYEDDCFEYMDCDYRKLQVAEQKISEIKDLCCEKIKKCNKACFMCSNTCIEEKIVTIIRGVV